MCNKMPPEVGVAWTRKFLIAVYALFMFTLTREIWYVVNSVWMFVCLLKAQSLKRERNCVEQGFLEEAAGEKVVKELFCASE